MSNPPAPAATAIRAGSAEQPWVLYLIECAGDRLYAGITNDLAARFQSHVDGRGARFTRAFAPVRIVAASMLPSRSAALKAEYALKRQPRSRKVDFLLACGKPLNLAIAKPCGGQAGGDSAPAARDHQSEA
jgi:putative endonuclease